MNKDKKIAWVYLIIAGLVEFVWAYFMKLSHGFTELIPSILAVFFIAVSFVCLERGVRVFGIGLSYAVFTGLGIAGTAIIGIIALGESTSFLKIISIIVLLCGIIGLKLCDEKEDSES